MIYLDKETMQEMWNQNVDGYLPILMRVYNPDVFWTDKEKSVYGQEDTYINFIADNVKVKYKNKIWLPCAFNFNAPEKDGKKLGNASVAISALDAHVKKLLRTIKLPSEVQIIAIFAKQKNEEGHIIYKYQEINSLKFTMTSATCNQSTATFSLTPDLALQQSIPYDTALPDRVPAIGG